VVLIIWVPVYKQGEEQFWSSSLLHIAASVIPASPDTVPIMHITGNLAAYQSESRKHTSVAPLIDVMYIY